VSPEAGRSQGAEGTEASGSASPPPPPSPSGSGSGSARTTSPRTTSPRTTPSRTGSPRSGGKAAARKRGRPASAQRAEGEPATSERILSSARAEFAGRGYDKTSVRAIARGAGVDPALVHHYFGTKEQVFTAAIQGALAPARTIPETMFTGDSEALGERMVAHILGVWENALTREPALAIVRSAVNNETAASIFRGLIGRQLVSRIAAGIGAPDAELRVELAIAQLVGTAMLRYVVKMEPLASASAEELTARLAPVVQRHLTGE
jgi:AcrR family transcriptional regulator